MFNTRSPRAFLVAFVAILALSLGLLASPVAAASFSITIHARLCPEGQPTTDIFIDCHPYGQSGQTFRVDSGASKVVASNGNVTFGRLSGGTHVVRRIAGQGPNEFLKERVFCLWKDGTQREIIPSKNGNFVISLARGSATCDVYLIPESAS